VQTLATSLAYQARPALAPFESAQGDFFTLPGQYGMDGFFASVLTRK